MGATTDRYVVISADCHGGASVDGYRPFLASRYHDEFDALGRRRSRTPTTTTPATTPTATGAPSAASREMEADGVVAEVIFPNTVPPFFPKVLARRTSRPAPPTATSPSGGPASRPTTAGWPTSAARRPGRRAGIAQIMLHDVDASVAEIEWAKANGLTGGVLLPGAPPGSGVPPLYAPDYEPIWSACEDLGLPINHHSGSAVPDMGPYPSAQMMFLLEVTWWAHRTLWHLIYSGVMERHPTLQFVFTEQGTAWVPEELDPARLLPRPPVGRRRRRRVAGGEVRRRRRRAAVAVAVGVLGPPVPPRLELHPPPRGRRCATQVGVDRIMWGSDFPHLEGCWPFSREHLRLAFADVPEDEVRLMVGAQRGRRLRLRLGRCSRRLADQLRPDAGRGRRAARGRRHPRRVPALPGVRRAPGSWRRA